MFPVKEETLGRILQEFHIEDITKATIRQIVAISQRLEKEAADDAVHLEMGNPGLPAVKIGVEAECEALRSGCASQYPNIMGIPELKAAGSNFIKAFLDVDIDAHNIIPTVGSMQGSFTLMLLLSQRLPGKDTMLFINPGFPAQQHQAKMLGMGIESFDIYNYRGERLEAKLESILSTGRITGIIYSNPNNPAWTNLTEQELEIIGCMATKYDAIVIEDLAYMGMDYRKYLGKPYEPPYVATVARYTHNYVLLVSASKIFSYAGQRISMVCIGNEVGSRRYKELGARYNVPTFSDAYVYGVLYAVSSGTSHSAQHAMAAMLKAATTGELDFVGECSEYARRSARARRIFIDNGFHLIYSTDGDSPVSDGFFFTVGYKDMSARELQQRLLAHGIATLSLPSTGSEQPGVRICVSMLSTDAIYESMQYKLKKFSDEY